MKNIVKFQKIDSDNIIFDDDSKQCRHHNSIAEIINIATKMPTVHLDAMDDVNHYRLALQLPSCSQTIRCLTSGVENHINRECPSSEGCFKYRSWLLTDVL